MTTLRQYDKRGRLVSDRYDPATDPGNYLPWPCCEGCDDFLVGFCRCEHPRWCRAQAEMNPHTAVPLPAELIPEPASVSGS